MQVSRGNVLQPGHVVNLSVNRGHILRDAAIRRFGIWVTCGTGITITTTIDIGLALILYKSVTT